MGGEAGMVGHISLVESLAGTFIRVGVTEQCIGRFPREAVSLWDGVTPERAVLCSICHTMNDAQGNNCDLLYRTQTSHHTCPFLQVQRACNAIIVILSFHDLTSAVPRLDGVDQPA